jgi:SHS2 domain-containing protein
MTYTILEHPSDVGIEATGNSLIEAFEQAAHGLISVILDITPPSSAPSETRQIILECEDHQQLLVRWLSEILFLYDAQAFVPSEITIVELTAHRLGATLKGEQLSPTSHRAHLDVKAVTYHQIRVEETSTGARIRVFLDI